MAEVVRALGKEADYLILYASAIHGTGIYSVSNDAHLFG
jgi:hypothetical protein